MSTHEHQNVSNVHVCSFFCKLNTGLDKVGTIVHGTAAQASVPPNTETVIGQITLSTGRWIIIASCWLDGASDIVVSLEIKNITGTTGWLRRPQAIGIAIANGQTTYPIIASQWSADSTPIVGLDITAIRIA